LPLTLALSPRGTFVKFENCLRGERGQSQDTCRLIQDRVKYKAILLNNVCSGAYGVLPDVMMRRLTVRRQAISLHRRK